MSQDALTAEDQVAKLQAQICALQQANTELVTQNAQLDEDLASTKAELQETQIMLAQAVVKANRPSQSSSTPNLPRYAPLPSTSRPPKRTRSPTLEYVDNPPPPSKKGKERERERNSENVAQPSKSAGMSVLPGKLSISKVKESPRKPVKLEFAPTVEVITIDDSDYLSDSEPIAAVEHTKETAELANGPSDQQPAAALDSDLEDPNILNEQFMDRGTLGPSTQVSRGDDSHSTPALDPNHEDAASAGNNEGIVVESARLLSVSERTSTPGLGNSRNASPTSVPSIDLKPKRKQKPRRSADSALASSLSSLYLDDAKPMPIPAPGPISLCVPRAFLRLAYGGRAGQFVQRILAERNPGPWNTPTPTSTGSMKGVDGDIEDETKVNSAKRPERVERQVVFPQVIMNPAMPTTAGAPGLLFSSRDEILHDAPWTLFCRDESKKNAVWKYVGEYENELVGKMTKEQFMAQSEQVQSKWAENIRKKKQLECYTSIRARIALRAEGIIPLVNKEREDELVRKEMKDIKDGIGKNVSDEQILAAFRNGDEAVNIVRMKCVKYDHFFANDIVNRFPEYPAMVAEEKVEKAEKLKQLGSGTQSKPKSKAGTKRTKSTRRSKHESDEDDESETSSGDSDEDELGSLSKSKRKRKAPSSSQKGKGKATETKQSRTPSSKSGSGRRSATGSASTSTVSRPRRQTRNRAPAILDVDFIDDDTGEGSGEDFDSIDEDDDDDEDVWKTSGITGRGVGGGARSRRPSSTVYGHVRRR